MSAGWMDGGVTALDTNFSDIIAIFYTFCDNLFNGFWIQF